MLETPEVIHLDWNDHEKFEQKFDLVIGCELVYAITHCDNLVSLLKKVLLGDSKLLMIIPTCRTNRDVFMKKLAELGQFEIKETILDDQSYQKSPLDDPSEDIFYPLRELKFSLLEVSFLNKAS